MRATSKSNHTEVASDNAQRTQITHGLLKDQLEVRLDARLEMRLEMRLEQRVDASDGDEHCKDMTERPTGTSKWRRRLPPAAAEKPPPAIVMVGRSNGALFRGPTSDLVRSAARPARTARRPQPAAAASPRGGNRAWPLAWREAAGLQGERC